ncbi:MAG: DEAD/DEAH box helicase [Paeniclostridium sordellii]|nr:DEAD/DEAH box helicase [Paeniclostridium sordellii]
MELFKHQIEALESTKEHNRVAYYLDMGLGKTFVGSEKMKMLNSNINLIICQKSKINDWIEHIKKYYPNYNIIKYNKTQPIPDNSVVIINYDLVWRREELRKLKNFTLMLDESSYIKNEKSNRSKFILRLKPDNVILLSGTPTGGKYEELYSQCKLLGWDITKKAYWSTYIRYKLIDIGGFKMPKVIGYKNTERLKRKLREHGAVFMKTEEAFELPNQLHNEILVENTNWYKMFKKDRLLIHDDMELVGDTTLTKMLYMRQLCGQYNKHKLDKIKELLESTEDRIIIFYNFKEEYEKIKSICKKLDKPISVVNGSENDLSNYNNHENSIVLVQYQAGAMGLNLQLSNKIVYFTLPLSSELFEQSKKRTHRIGQDRTCMYYYLIVENSIEEHIFKVLEQRKDYTDKLFEMEM